MNRIFFTKNNGFTLIELMFVIVIIGILGAVAYPSYKDLVISANRADGIASLERLQVLQEKYRMNNPTYADALPLLGINSNASTGGKYTMSVTRAGQNSYVVSAVPLTTDTVCGTLSIFVNVNAITYNSATIDNKVCWKY